MNQSDKRSQICGMCFLPISKAQVENTPGTDYIKVSGEWTDLGVSSGELKEKQDSVGAVVEQELKAVVTDTGENNTRLMHDLITNEGLVLLKMTNGSHKVVGTDQFPVSISLENSGSPAKLTLSFKRNSPESAKLFTSF